MRIIKTPVPTEDEEQSVVRAYLDRIGILWCHVPNAAGIVGGEKDGRRIAKLVKLRDMGQKKGVPDILIFERPTTGLRAHDRIPGAVIEMKRRKGGRLSPEQKEWLAHFERVGWLTAVCRGADEAITQLQEWGYR